MITAFRRLFGSTVGKIVALMFLGLIGIAFAASDISGSMGTGAPAAGSVARVGDVQITDAMLRDRVRSGYDQARQERPTLTMAQYVAGGAVTEAMGALVDGAAFDQYAAELGVRASKRMVDARIADLPVFQGVTGKFEDSRFRQFLASANLSEAQLREDIARQVMLEQLGGALGPLPRLPSGIAQPYASLLLEQREGRATFIPSARFAPKAPPTDAELTSYLAANRARYTLPERRIVRYAVIDPATLAVTAVTDAEIAAAYKAQSAKFTPSVSRTFDQVIAPDEATARRFATGDFAANVKAAGLASSRISPANEAALATSLNAEAAKAAFAARDGAVVGPIRVPLGFVVLKAVSTTRNGGKTLAQATPELRAALTETKRADAASGLFDTLLDRANNGAALSELAESRQARIVTTPPLLADGQLAIPGAAPLSAQTRELVVEIMQGADDGVAQVLADEDSGTIVIGEVQQTIAAAPPPFAAIRERLATDWARTQGARQARDVARRIAKAVEGGKTLEAAAAAERAAAPVQTISARRGEIARLAQAGRVPAELSLLFAMEPRSVRTLELPDGQGWMVLSLGAVARPTPSEVPTEATASVARTLQQAIGNESVQAFIAAARRAVRVTVNDAAVKAITDELSGAVPASTSP